MRKPAENRHGEATLLLRRLQAGDELAGDELLPIVYAELRRLAQAALSGRHGQTLQTTALIHEAWIRLVDGDGARWESRGHFLGVAARAMRSVLVDHARRRGAVKRGGGKAPVDLDAVVFDLEERSADLLALNDELDRLAQVDGKLAQIVEMRFFGGLDHPTIAETLGTSLRSVERGWRTARALLYARLVPAPE